MTGVLEMPWAVRFFVVDWIDRVACLKNLNQEAVSNPAQELVVLIKVPTPAPIL
jgi:hypothetical protein